MNYILITDTDVTISRSLDKLKKTVKAELHEDNFTQIGTVRLCKMTDVEFATCVDANDFMKIPANKLFKKDSNTLYLLPLYLMILVVLVQGCVK